MGLDRQAAGLLVARSDAPGEHAGLEADQILTACEKAGATEVFRTDDPDEGEAFCAARRFAIPAVERKGALLLEDVGVPLPRLSELVTGIAAIAENRKVLISVIAHAGDGNTHPLIVHDPVDPDETARAHEAFGEIMDLAISLGGTITGEHGVGRLKKAWLPDQVGPEVIDLSRRIKDALDPHGILNPGAVL
jgi:glycolate oxidase